MITSPLPSAVILIIVFIMINIKKSNTLPSKSSLVEVKTNQDDIGGVHSNLVDIHVAMESGGTPINLKNVIRDEIKSILRDSNNSIEENLEQKNPVSARSVKYDSQKNNLDNINTKLQTIESILKDIQADNTKSSVTVDQRTTCLRNQNSLGVQHTTCPKPLKDQKLYPKNCKEILRNGNNKTGIYEIFPKYSEEPFPVLCDMETKGGGWTHIQKRFDGSQDFYLEWRPYKFGFGNLDGEFWLGLQKIYLLSGFESTELLVEIVDRDNVSAFAHYTSFAIGSEPGGYTLDRLSGFSGDAGDSLVYHLGSKFSTKDLDFTKDACATNYLGGWWYQACHESNLNGKYINLDLPAKFKYQGLHWKSFRSYPYSHAKSRMLVRPLNV